jgi:hypothetical protein
MNLFHGDYVSVYTPQGKFMCHGRISSKYGVDPEVYDIQPVDHPSLKMRLIGIKAAHIRKPYVAPHMVDIRPKHILDFV